MNGAFAMYNQTTFEDLFSAISSPASAGGPTPCDLQDGRRTSQSGPGAAPVSRSVAPGSNAAQQTSVTCGPCSENSSGNVAQKSFSESKSQVRLGANGYQVTYRTCSGCGIEKPYSEFYVNSKGGRRTKCKECSKSQRREYGRDHETEESRSFNHWRRKRRGYALTTIARYRARQKGMEFNLDPQEIQNAIDAGVCQLTGIPFNLDGGKTWDSPSLDRIDSRRGYTKDNVRVILYCLNVMANTWGENKIVEIAHAIMERRRERSNSFQERLTASLKRRLPAHSSQEYALIWKEWVTPSGLRIPALRASGHRTSGKDCSGWATPRQSDPKCGYNYTANCTGKDLTKDASLAGWPTPRSEDSEQTGAHRGVPDTLTSAARVAGWATPATRDYKDTGDMSESMVRRDGQERNDTVPRQAFGMTPSFTPAGTGKPVAYQLNPRFSLWLMGYPVEWACCGELAMQSFRKSRRSS